MTDTMELAVIEEDEGGGVLATWAQSPRQAWAMADALMGMHPAAKEVGLEAMRSVAQLAVMTGANPLPGSNGIHVWKDEKGRICTQFGMGFWRSEADRAGGILWIDPPRPMTETERKTYGIQPGVFTSICRAALGRDVFQLRAQARSFGDDLSFNEAKREVARVGVGIATSNEYGKKGRPLQWTADERAERDLLRKLVPIGGQDRPVYHDWNPARYTATERPRITNTDGSAYTLDDANRDLYGDDSPPVTRRVEAPEDGVIEDAAPQEQPPTPPAQPATNGNGQQVDDSPLPADEQAIYETTNDFATAVASLLETDAADIRRRMGAANLKAPRTPQQRVEAYRQLRGPRPAETQPAQPALIDAEPEPAQPGAEYRE